ncbi:MAG: hypothetical protein ABIT01_07385, partial [Thermoanaerobaculia bacterium]
MNPKLLAVIKREYLQQVRNKAFWISTVLIPTLGLIFIGVQVVLAQSMVAKGRIGVIDLSGRLYEPLVAEQQVKVDSDEETNPESMEKSRKKIPTTVEFFKVEATPETLAAVRTKLNEDVQKERIKSYVILQP